MAKKEQGDGFWPRMIITLVVVIWAAILGGSWLGQKIVDRQRSGEEVSNEMHLPSPRPRPWKTADPNLQQEVDEQRQGLVRTGPTPGRTVTASPVASASPEASPEASPSPSPEATPEPSPSPEPPEPSPSPTRKPSPKPSPAPPKPAPEPSPEDSPEAPEPTPTSQAHGGGSYQLQFGSFSQEDYARELVDKLAREGQDARVETLQTDQGTFYRVRGGSFSDEGAARNQADKLRGSGLDAFVVRP